MEKVESASTSSSEDISTPCITDDEVDGEVEDIPWDDEVEDICDDEVEKDIPCITDDEVIEEVEEAIKNKPDLLLMEMDVAPKDECIMTKIPAKQFIEVYGNIPPVQSLKERYKNMYKNARLVITLPLCTSEDEVIPIPFIIDTGYPHSMCLAKKTRSLLKELGSIYKPKNSTITADTSCYRLIGNLCRGIVNSLKIENPYAFRLPKDNEFKPKSDPRGNLLGLLAIQKLQILHWGANGTDHDPQDSLSDGVNSVTLC